MRDGGVKSKKGVLRIGVLVTKSLGFCGYKVEEKVRRLRYMVSTNYLL
jgi:hypothetical protein